ncbi:MAG: DHA2 family efflux MFS transporter permease subunit [Thermoleophilia bacterium]|nr:DHA2 family efflux MFS transporter permease subunit [Thermoleophilia bacterium]
MEAPPPAETDRKKWYVLAALALGMFMALLDATIVNIAVPAIIADLGTSITQVSWVLNAYNITLVVLFLSMGRIADRYGKKRIFIAGLVIFTFFSLACGLAPSIGFLIAFRVGQAVGAAGMVPVSLAIMLGVFPRSQHGMAVGIWAALGSVAAALGPGLGGVLVTYGSWHWIFFVNVPIGIVALVAAVILVPESHGAEGTGAGVDVPGIGLSAVGIFALTLALVQGNQWGWTSARVLGLFALWAATLALFVVWELRTSSPMLDLRLFRIRPFTAANASMLLVGTAMGGAIFLLVIFMVTVMGYSELRAALSITPLPLTVLVLAPFVGRRVDRVGPRAAAAVGGGFFTAGLLALALLDATATTGDIIWRVMLIGAGIAFSMPTLMSAGMTSLPDSVRGVGSGVLNTSRQMGFVLGVAILVAIFSQTTEAAVTASVTQAAAYVQSQSQIPASVKPQIVAGIEKTAAARAKRGVGGGGSVGDFLAGVPAPPPGSPQEQSMRSLASTIGQIFKTNLGHAFFWPYTAAALAALLSVVPALFTGRRLGEQLGRQI